MIVFYAYFVTWTVTFMSIFSVQVCAIVSVLYMFIGSSCLPLCQKTIRSNTTSSTVTTAAVSATTLQLLLFKARLPYSTHFHVFVKRHHILEFIINAPTMSE